MALATPLCGSSGGSGFTRAVAVLDIRQRVQSERSERRNFFLGDDRAISDGGGGVRPWFGSVFGVGPWFRRITKKQV